MPTNKNEKQQYELLPPDETTVWRYLSLAKFLALLKTKSIFFSRADFFDDPFEGSFTEGSLKEDAAKWGDWGIESLHHAYFVSKNIPFHSFISCWHASEVESVALWKIYAKEEGGVAIKSTIGDLKKAFPSITDRIDNKLVTQDIYRVQYIDYRTVHPHLNNLAGPLCYKRQAFSYEQEIRVIRQVIPTVPKPREGHPDGRAIQISKKSVNTGLEIAVNIDELVKAIYLTPFSPSWLLPTICGTIKAFGKDIDCSRSNIDELPEFGGIGLNLSI